MFDESKRSKIEIREEKNNILLESFLDDGMDEERAQEVYQRLYGKAKIFLDNIHSFGDLLDSITEDINMTSQISKGQKIDISIALELLPFFIRQATFDIDIKKYLERTVFINDSDWENRSKFILRYFDLIKDSLDREEIKDLIIFFAEKNNSNEQEYLALYIKKIMDYFDGDSDFIEKLFTHFRHSDLLKILSGIPISKIPESYQKKIKGWVNNSEQAPISDDIISVRSVDDYTGDCTKMDYYHSKTLLDPDSEYYGQSVLIYIKGKLVGSIKTQRDMSMIAFDNFMSFDGTFALVKGGVYAVPKKIKDQISNMRDKSFPSIKLDSLKVYPLRMINSIGYYNDPWDDEKYLDYFKEDMALLDHTKRILIGND